MTDEIYEQIKGGGKWLGAARTWMQNYIKNGDTMEWSSIEIVSMPFCDLEDFARTVAVAAIAEDRERR
ncbi:MAG: hypothetical protein GY941_05030 [Planctomycetes bacterium]|nr:hypothetical protein [Planctomycetota bacterium]